MKTQCAFDAKEEVARITFPPSRIVIPLCEEHRAAVLDALGMKEFFLDALERERNDEGNVFGKAGVKVV